MKQIDAKKRNSLFQPLQMRPTNLLSATSRNNNNDGEKMAKRKAIPKEQPDSDSDDEVPLSLLSRSLIPQKRRSPSGQAKPIAQPQHSRARQTKHDNPNKRLAVHDLRNQESAIKTPRRTTEQKNNPKTVQTKLSFSILPKRENSQSSQSMTNEIPLKNNEKINDNNKID